jgi:hypothetical protein
VSGQSRINTPFNPKAAVLYGQFIKAAYSMYDPATLTPALVGAGFARIYDTLEVIERPTGAATSPVVAQSLKSIGGFCQQVAALVRRHAAATVRATGRDTSGSIEITGHSLGAALATLYTLENALTDKIPNPGLCTFASPFVGDSTFAGAFNGLGLTSWRIVNSPDIVPNLPPEILGFTHINTLQLYNSSGNVQPSLSCWHALGYLPKPDRPDAAARSGLSLVGGACRSARGSGSRGSCAFGRNARHHHKLFRSERPVVDYHNGKD